MHQYREEIIMIKTVIQIEGMMCGMCEAHVSDAIRRAVPVKKVSASHTKGEATLLSEQPIEEKVLREAVEETGYRVGEITSAPYEKKGLLGLFRSK